MNGVRDGGLRELAGPGMYRRNAFRITGVPTDADRRTVRGRQQQVMPALRLGADIDLGHSLPVTADEVANAFDRILGDPRLRVVDELLWLWDTPDATCGCAASLHRDHDAAVRAHSAALDLEAAGGPTGTAPDDAERLWEEAATLWGKALRRAAFWDHVRHRIARLDDRQLDESLVDTLRDELPGALVTPLMELAAAPGTGQARLARQARGWPMVSERTVDDQLERSAARIYERVDTAVEKAGRPLDEGRPAEAAGIVYEEALPAVRHLEALVPHRRHRRTASARNTVAIVLNNCATALIDTLGPDAAGTARPWLATATELATDHSGLAAIRQNAATLDEIVRTFETIRSRVAELVALGRPDTARAMLNDIKRQLRGGPGTQQIDRLLAGLGTRRPPRGTIGGSDPDLLLDSLDLPPDAKERLRATLGDPLAHAYRPPLPAPAAYGRGWTLRDSIASFFESVWWVMRDMVKPVLVLAALGGAAFLIWHCTSDGADRGTGSQGTAALYSEKISDNAPPGRCIATEDDWKRPKDKVPVADCGTPHWGEVLGYARLGTAPSPYPGADQTAALARFHCGLLLARQGLSQKQFTTDFAYPGEHDWNTGGKRFENYATCVAHRTDGSRLPARQVSRPDRKPGDVSVTMDLFHTDIWMDPPVGTCVQDKHQFDTSQHALAVVTCERRHYAEVLGYPQLYGSDTSTWPGDDTVHAAAQRACRKLTGDKPLSKGHRLNVTYPGREWWDLPHTKIYAVCAATREDGKPFTGSAR